MRGDALPDFQELLMVQMWQVDFRLKFHCWRMGMLNVIGILVKNGNKMPLTL